MASGAGSFAPWRWRSSHILLAVHSLNLEGGGGGGGRGGEGGGVRGG